MNEQYLIDNVEKIFVKLSKFVDEIEFHKLHNEFKHVKSKTEKLERLIEKYLEPSESELSGFGYAVILGAEAINDFILELMATRLKQTYFFYNIDETVYNVAHYLTQIPLYLNQDVAINAVKFGYVIAIQKSTFNRATEMWSNSFKNYLENHCQFDHTKVVEILSATEPLASKLVNSYVPGLVGSLYFSNLCKDLTLLQES